jgi:hypothetical protein
MSSESFDTACRLVCGGGLAPPEAVSVQLGSALGSGSALSIFGFQRPKAEPRAQPSDFDDTFTAGLSHRRTPGSKPFPRTASDFEKRTAQSTRLKAVLRTSVRVFLSANGSVISSVNTYLPGEALAKLN